MVYSCAGGALATRSAPPTHSRPMSHRRTTRPCEAMPTAPPLERQGHLSADDVVLEGERIEVRLAAGEGVVGADRQPLLDLILRAHAGAQQPVGPPVEREVHLLALVGVVVRAAVDPPGDQELGGEEVLYRERRELGQVPEVGLEL